MLKNWLKTFLNYKINYKKKYSLKEYDDINFNLLKTVTNRFKIKEWVVDDITWNDLELDKVFSKLNWTHTLPGEELLYYWMKTPTCNQDDFNKRQNKLNSIKLFNKQIALDLESVGSFNDDYRDVILNNKPEKQSNKKPLIIYTSLVVMIMLFLVTRFSILLFGASISLLAIIIFHYLYTMKNSSKIISFDYILKIIYFHSKNSSQIYDVFSNDYDLDKINLAVSQLVKYKNSINKLEGVNPLKDLADVLTLSTYRSCIKIEKLIYNNKNEIIEAADILGEIDLSLAINNYVNINEITCVPDLKDNLDTLSFKESRNLMIKNCVHNSITIDNSIVITGSNMGGKSSFLRQIGISVVLGQSFCFSESKIHKGGFFKIISSISLNDDITSGKSYFLKEAEAIHRMINSNETKYNTLILIDEIFKGTNPIERLAASVEILNRLSKTNKVIVTTHDIGILSDLIEYDFYHFEHNITKSKMEFDYKIKPGITEVRNAVKLMEYIEYPEDLIESINKRIIQMNSIV